MAWEQPVALSCQYEAMSWEQPVALSCRYARGVAVLLGQPVAHRVCECCLTWLGARSALSDVRASVDRPLMRWC